MGSGLVRTVDNFGTTGEAPLHPELVDHLAQEFIRMIGRRRISFAMFYTLLPTKERLTRMNEL